MGTKFPFYKEDKGGECAIYSRASAICGKFSHPKSHTIDPKGSLALDKGDILVPMLPKPPNAVFGFQTHLCHPHRFGGGRGRR